MAGALQVASLFAVIGLDDQLTPGLKKASGNLGGFRSDTNSFISDMKGLGSNLSKYLTLPILGFGAAAIKSFADSETQIAQLDAVLRSTSLADGTFTEHTASSADDLDKLTAKIEKSKERIADLQSQISNAGEGTNTNRIIDKMNEELLKLDKLSASYDAGSKIVRNYVKISHMTRDELLALSKAYQNTTRYSDEQVLSAENLLLTFTNIGKEAFPDATKTVLDMSAALGQDLKSSAIQLGKALQDPVEGITALRRVGVNFSDTQKAIIEGMVAAGDIAGAQKLILKELNVEFGGSAEAAGKTLPGALDILKNKWGEFLEVIGEKMAPDVKNVVKFLSDLMDQLVKLPAPIIEGAIAFGGFLLILGPVITTAANLSKVIVLLNGAFASLAWPIALILGPLALAGALVAAYQGNWLGFRDAVDALGHSLRELQDAIMHLDLQKLTGNDVFQQFAGIFGSPLLPKQMQTISDLPAQPSPDSSLDAALRGGGAGGSFMRDSGGPIRTNQIFGSNVPELFMPKSSGTAIPLHQLNGGGNTYQISVQVGEFVTPTALENVKREIFEGVTEAEVRAINKSKGG